MQKFEISRNEALDSTLNWKQHSEKDWVNTLHNLIEQRPFGDHKFYVFMFVKRIDDLSGIKKMYMQPRLTKPEPLPGTTLLRVDPNNIGEAVIIWTLPNENTFNFYTEGKLFADPFVHLCVQKYLKRPWELMKKEEGDLSDEEILEIYQSRIKEKTRKKKR